MRPSVFPPLRVRRAEAARIILYPFGRETVHCRRGGGGTDSGRSGKIF